MYSMKQLRYFLTTVMVILATASGRAQTSYGISIGGIEITSDNYQDINNANFHSLGEQGTVTFDPATSTLMLDGVMIDGTLATTCPVNIMLIGEVRVEAMSLSAYESALSFGADCTISGPGSLYCIAMSGEGIYIAENSTLTIKDCTVNVEAGGTDPGYGGSGYDNGTGHAIRSVERATAGALVVDHAQLTASGMNGSIRYIKSLTMSGCELADGAVFDLGYVQDKYGSIATSVAVNLIPEPYAVLDGQGTLTFYYDMLKHKRQVGMVYDVDPAATVNQAWENNESITAVDFDESFANYDGLTSLHGFFLGLENLTEIRKLDRLVTTNVTDMEAAFYYCTSLTELDLRAFNTANVTRMSWMFYCCSSLKTIIVGSGWDTTNVTGDEGGGGGGGIFMFSSCENLVGSQGTAYDASVTDCTYARIDRAETGNAPGYLSGVPEAYVVWLETECTFYYNSKKEYWQYQQQLQPGLTVYDANERGWYTQFPSTTPITNFPSTKITKLVIDDSFAGYHGLTDLSYCFAFFDELESIEGLQNLNTENVTNMEAMFFFSYKLKELDLRHFDTSKVTNMDVMFTWCSELSKIRCNDDWKRDGVSGDRMFNLCPKLTGSIPYDENKTGIEMANPVTGYFTVDGQKGNMNGDDVLDSEDVLFLNDLVLGIITPTAGQVALGDMNCDGELTVADVTLLIDVVVNQAEGGQ